MADDQERGGASAPKPSETPARPGRERDFGDSAGYGSGGSTKDFHEVGDLDADPVKGRRNPLDEVVKVKNPVER